jgi:hypothetical protein
MHWSLLPLFAILVLLALVTRVKLSVAVSGGKVPLAFARELRSMTTDYLRVNWSGQAEDLHQALRPLLEKARALALERGVPIDEDMLRAVLVQAVSAERLAKRPQLEAAMDSIARPTSRAA